MFDVLLENGNSLASLPLKERLEHLKEYVDDESYWYLIFRGKSCETLNCCLIIKCSNAWIQNNRSE